MEEAAPNPLAAAFPAPPPFWQSFTPENLERIAKLRAEQDSRDAISGDEVSKLPVRLLDLPPELRFLQPPDPPTDGIYRCFGDTYNINDPLPTLSELGIQQLYPEHSSANRAFILKKLAKSLLLNFLELTGLLSTNPEHYKEKVEDLRTLFINFHHLLNEYRPHQARESLILMMQEQLDRSRAETEGIKAMKERVEIVIEGLGGAKLIEDTGLNGTGMVRDVKEEGRDIWEALEKEFS